MNTGTEEIRDIRETLQFIETDYSKEHYEHFIANAPTWLRSLLEENERLKSEESWKAISEMAQREAKQLREELERTRVSAKHWQDRYDRDADRLPNAMVEAESLRSELAAKDKVMQPIREFVKSVIRVAFDGGSLDGGDIQDMGVKHGLLNETKYDPEKHGESDYADPGDPWFVFSDILNATINESGGSEDENKHKVF